MKKLYAIVLSFALVLAFAGIANAAAVDVTGSITISGEYTNAWSWGFSNGAAFANINFSKEFENASASMGLAVGNTTTYMNWDDANGDGEADEGEYDYAENTFGLTLKTADYTYKFSEEFSLAAVYNADGITAYDAPVLTDLGVGSTVLKGALAFEGGSLAVYTNAVKPFQLTVAGSYAMDPVTLGAGFKYDAAEDTPDDPATPDVNEEVLVNTYQFGVNVTYPVLETLKVTGDLFYSELGEADFGIKAAYADDMFTANASFMYVPEMSISADASVKVIPDVLTVSGDVAYDITGKALGAYKVKADVVATETVSLYAMYAANQTWDNDGDGVVEAVNGDGTGVAYVKAGTALKIDGTNTVNVDYLYVLDAGENGVGGKSDAVNKLSVGLTIGF